MGKTREQKILDAGLASLGPEHKLVLTPIIRAMAAMIAEATKPKAKDRPKERPEAKRAREYATGEWALSIIKTRAPNAGAWEPVQARSLVALGRACLEMRLTNYDLVELSHWLSRGALSWMREKPTVSYITRNLDDLVAKARAFGRQESGSALDRIREGK